MKGKTVVVALALVLILAPAASAKRKPVKVVTGTQTTTVDVGVPPGPVSGTANCPPKTRVLGGGFAAFPSGGMTRYIPLESARVGNRAWRATGVAVTGGSSPLTLTTEAYCAKLRGKVRTATESAQLGSESFSSVELTATCPRNTRLLAGGFQVTSADLFGLANAFAYENARDRANSNAWSVKALRGPSGALAQVQALAYCLKPKKPKRAKGGKGSAAAAGKKGRAAPAPRPLTELAGQAPLPSFVFGLTTAATPRCEGKRRGVSGGFGNLTPTNEIGVGRFYEARYVDGVWVASAFQFTNAPANGLITAYAYCG